MIKTIFWLGCLFLQSPLYFWISVVISAIKLLWFHLSVVIKYCLDVHNSMYLWFGNYKYWFLLLLLLLLSSSFSCFLLRFLVELFSGFKTAAILTKVIVKEANCLILKTKKITNKTFHLDQKIFKHSFS